MKPSHTCIIIGGPTASGKTELAIRLAQHYGTSILSADSRQCYRELNIGVAKPTAGQLAAVRHYFINSHSIQQSFSAADFETYAVDVLKEMFVHSPLAIVAGGTGLYLHALIHGLDDMPLIAEEIRQEILHQYDQHGLEWLQEAVRQEDPLFFGTGENQNPQRLMRALEIKRSTGKSIRDFQQGVHRQRDFQFLPIRITLGRAELYRRINLRVEEMMQQGLLDEARALLPYRHLNALQTVGYQELFAFFDGLCSLEEAVEQIQTNTRHYAKRQETWFKKFLNGAVFEARQTEEIIQFIDKELSRQC